MPWNSTPTVGGRYCLAATRILLRMRKVFSRGNMLVSNEEVEQWILRYIPLEAFVCIREYLQKL